MGRAGRPQRHASAARGAPSRARRGFDGQPDTLDAFDYMAQKAAGERSRISGLRKEKRTRQNAYGREHHCDRGNALKPICRWAFDVGGRRFDGRIHLKTYVARKNKECNGRSGAEEIFGGRGCEDGRQEDSESDCESEAEGDAVRGAPRLADAVELALAEARGGGLIRIAASECGEPGAELETRASACWSDGWEVVDGRFDVLSVDDLDLR